MLTKCVQFCLFYLLLMSLTGCSILKPLYRQPYQSDIFALKTKPAPAPQATALKATEMPRHIALLLPQQGDFANAAKAIQAGFNDAYQSASTKPAISVYDTSQANINTIYEKALSDGADFIIGPLEKANVVTLQHRQTIPVITIALNETGIQINPTNLYQFALSPINEVNQLADKASQQGYRTALMITPSGEWGNNIASALKKRFEANGGLILDSLSVDNSKALNNSIQRLLQKNTDRSKSKVDAIFMVVQPVLARQIKPLLKFYGATNIPVYSTSLVYSGLVNSRADTDLNRVIFCDMPLVLAQQGQWADVRQQFTLSQPAAVQSYIRLYGLGWDAALLTQSFNQLPKTLSGATGNLYLDNNAHVLRHLTWAMFNNGMPVIQS